MVIPFSSVSSCLRTIQLRLSRKQLLSGDELAIDFSSRAKGLTELFALGRLIAACHLLTSIYRLKIEFRFGATALAHASALGLTDYCRGVGILCTTAQNELPFDGGGTGAPVQSPVDTSARVYWRCLVPLTYCQFEAANTEREVLSQVLEITSAVSELLFERLASLGVKPQQIRTELHLILSQLLRELLSNAVTHSGSEGVLIALTASRDTSPESRNPSRGAGWGTDHYQVLVQDLGIGVLRSVSKRLRERDPIERRPEFFSFPEVIEQSHLLARHEASLLTNLFGGDLVVRRGRKSEGLHELGRVLSWFGGTIQLHTGRTEMLISNDSANRLAAVPSRRPGSLYYIPGVTTVAQLPSLALRTARLSSQRQSEVAVPRTPTRTFEKLPAGLLGATEELHGRRRAEFDAELLVTQWESRIGINETQPIWRIHLQYAENIDLLYLDRLIQELAKRPEASRFVRSVVFCGVPRRVVRSLATKNSNSFLMLKGQFVTFLDEVEQPHFLGVPPSTTAVLGVHDALTAIYFHDALSRDELGSLGFQDTVIAETCELLGVDTDLPWHMDHERLRSSGLRWAIREQRRNHIPQIEAFKIQQPGTLFRLSNGTCVRSFYDFCLFWSDHQRLVDSAQLLTDDLDLPVVDALVTFINNGDRLASSLQQVSHVASLVVVDPTADIEGWQFLPLEGDYLIVLDALYPGDDQAGFVYDFVQFGLSMESRAKAVGICAFADFRENQGEPLCGLPVLSPASTSRITRPEFANPSSEDIIREGIGGNAPKPVQTLSLRDGRTTESSIGYYRYSGVELSSEMWQNVVDLGILDTRRTGREARNILFFENNERFLESARMRQTLREFVAAFAKHVCRQKIDVVLHPTHSVGSHLAHLLATESVRKPVILQLTQRSYGGPIEPSPDDYRYYREQLGQTRKGRLKAVIVDDSVLTGHSIFSMLGVARRLDLEVIGVLSLLSRLTPEASAALSTIRVPFLWLYRLHMPVLNDTESPDRRFLKLREQVAATCESHFAARFVESNKFHDSSFLETLIAETSTDIEIRLETTNLAPVVASHMDTHVLKHVLLNLLLNPDIEALRFKTRLAIAYNFLGQLVYEEHFWNMLHALCQTSTARLAGDPGVALCRAVCFISVFSRHVSDSGVFSEVERLCERLGALGTETIESAPDLVQESLMQLAAIGSPKFFAVGASALDRALTTDDPKRIEVLGAVAAGLHVVVEARGSALLDSPALDQLFEVVARYRGATEKDFVLVDVFSPLIRPSYLVREHLGIGAWRGSDDLIELLSDETVGSRESIDYLSEAPGYTCTLKAVLAVCKADIVVLYAKSAGETEFGIRAVETRGDVLLEIDADILRANTLPPRAKRRLEAGDVFVPTDTELEFLNRLSSGPSYKWCFGANVRATTGQSYFAIVGYREHSPSTSFRNTAFSYWLEIEQVLRRVLPKIHSRHVESSRAWNTVIQCLRPVHALTEISGDSVIARRRNVLRLAAGQVTTAELVRRTVRMASERAYSVNQVKEAVWRIETRLQDMLAKTLKAMGNEDPLFGADWPATWETGTGHIGEGFLTYPSGALDFILYECLLNALTYFESRIHVELSIRQLADDLDGRRPAAIHLTVMNDRLMSPRQIDSERGLQACRAAVTALGGTFSVDATQPTEWTVRAVLPGLWVPKALQEALGDTLK